MIGTDSYHIIIDIQKSSPTTIEIIELDSKMALQPIEPLRAKSIGNGVIRLYREFENEIPVTGEASSNQLINNPGDDTMVAILAVPTYFTATDLLGFIGEKNVSNISHLRILKSNKPNRFLVLIKFRDVMKAAEFQYHFNGKPFNSMEPETCHVIYVKAVQVTNSHKDDSVVDSMIPFLLQDPFTSATTGGVHGSNSPSSSSAVLTSNLSDNYHLIELPTCPVCLERMDATVTGLLTIPCQHTFHCQCLTKWKDDTCPVCRYSHNIANERVRRSTNRLQQLSIRDTPIDTPLPRSLESQQQHAQISSLLEAENDDDDEDDDVGEICMGCDETENLWICLICGNIGCSRYAPEQHSLKHFVDTGHCFAMEIATSRVWDYAGDKYVHRLVTNESDGKLVELPDKEDKINGGSWNRNDPSFDKVDEVGFEYSQLLISQLASQREYYESLLEQQQTAPKSRRGSGNNNNNNNNLANKINQERLTELEIKFEDLKSTLSDFTNSLIPSLKEKIQSKDEKLNKVMRELNISNSLNEALSKKVEHLTKVNNDYKTTIENLTGENKALNEQVTDLMFFLDSQEKFKNESQEVKDGTIVIQQPPSVSRKNRRKKK
ncbi:RING finger protein, putative [Candida dubliniensis CD36]|uniref:RING finger protein, putative n=1 Tax=Candida dubliniensis (strain CD36 / ATCC MYA-646 / CBS 7987 / NCPF 3949 / NRRL Y-17841) TaxID=573826 RepID=B9WAR6_CANDC|nr:RING finger protein, putative [Candida dubliniensis CD36]CAX43486.1 RING finger protein, putative [Candida dubliniensis CD36]